MRATRNSDSGPRATSAAPRGVDDRDPARRNAGLVALALAVTLAGCAAPGPEDMLVQARRLAPGAGELGLVTEESRRRERDDAVERMLADPLDMQAAWRVALLHSPALQALLARAWAAEAAGVQSGRLPNPRLALERLSRGDETEIGRVLSFGLLEVLTLPWRAQQAERAAEAARLQLAADVLRLSAQVRQQWVRAVAAQQLALYHEQVRDAAHASADLALRMQAVGNYSRLQRDREHAFYADATAQLARARQAAVVEREALVRLLGLSARQAARLRLPDRLPDLPGEPRSTEQVAAAARQERVDVQLAQRRLDAADRGRALARWTSLTDVELGLVRNSETHQPTQRGVELELALPLFDAGHARRAGASAEAIAALQHLRQVQLEASSTLRERYAAYRTAYDLARHFRDEVVPLRQRIVDEMLLRYNGMLVSVFELLAESRTQIGSVIAAIEAQRDFWIAQAALDAAILGVPAEGASLLTQAPPANGASAGH
ncbi:MAG TPA: TolC family protein [Burkholderiaceae bacterium]|nr:TolC family protein [Burkholderiaceae bacterium]